MLKSATRFSWNRDWLWAGLLFAATFLAYRPAWSGQPLWDDDVYMTPPALRSISGLGQIWKDQSSTKQYYPLVHSVLWMENRLWGQSTLGYHLLNILLHGSCALLLVRMLRRLRIPGAWLAGGIFALHPVMVESVAWITELKNTLSGVFFLCAGLAYLKFDCKRDKKHYTIALVLFLLGLLAKSAIVPLPAALLVLFWWMRGRIEWKRDAVPLLPFFVIGIASGALTTWVERRFMGAVGTDYNLAFVDRCLVAGRAVWFYLYKLLWPANLIFVYPRWHVDATAVWQYLLPAAFLLASVLFWELRNRSRAPFAVLLYFSGMLFPALGFFNIYFTRYSFVADHFQYLACIGPIAAAAALIVKGTGMLKERLRGLVQPLLYGVLLSVLFLLSQRQSGIYTDAETLFRATIARNDDCLMAHNNLGILLGGMGRSDEALAHYQKALELDPHRVDAHYNLGSLLESMGRTNEALVYYQKALEIDPNHAKGHNNLGVLLRGMGRPDEALAHYLRASAIDPNFGDVHYNLGNLFEDMGRTDEAFAHYQKALEIGTNQAETHYNLGFLLAKMGRADEAMAHYQKAFELNPTHFDAHNNLGILLAGMGRTDDAISHFRRAVEINPQAIRALKNLAFALVEKGQLTEAAPILQDALALARSAGDEAQTKMIAQILGKITETINSSRASPTAHAQ
jgi:tetratricopeptide (TPR) repeat protein